MKTHSFYDPKTGQLSPYVFSGPDAALALNTPAGLVAIEGRYDHVSQRVDLSGAKPFVIDFQPSRPSDDHEWDVASRRWQLTAEASAREHRRNVARAEIARLVESQHDFIRRSLLGRGGLDELKTIDDRIVELEKEL